MITIGRLARQFNLSRSTLLYYDSIGLLTPSTRTKTRYRQYSEKDKDRLEKICLYRQVGIPLEDIRKILDASDQSVTAALENHLKHLSEQIHALRRQQFAIVEMLKSEKIVKHHGILDKEGWVRLLKSTGLDDDDMKRWHREFEKTSPQAHLDFLLSLGISQVEADRIRTWCSQE
jgi:DNA-binding transcriptional MerR regulator